MKSVTSDFSKLGGQIAERIGDYDRALAYYALYSEYVGVNPWTNFNMGNIYMKKGETDKAYEQFKACYQLSLVTKGYKTVVPPYLKRKLKEHGIKLKDLGI